MARTFALSTGVSTPGGYWNWCNISVTTDRNAQKPDFFGFYTIAPSLNENKSLYEAVLFVVAEDEGINQGRGR